MQCGTTCTITSLVGGGEFLVSNILSVDCSYQVWLQGRDAFSLDVPIDSMTQVEYALYMTDVMIRESSLDKRKMPFGNLATLTYRETGGTEDDMDMSMCTMNSTDTMVDSSSSSTSFSMYQENEVSYKSFVENLAKNRKLLTLQIRSIISRPEVPSVVNTSLSYMKLYDKDSYVNSMYQAIYSSDEDISACL